jgi:hypothetical protein
MDEGNSFIATANKLVNGDDEKHESEPKLNNEKSLSDIVEKKFGPNAEMNNFGKFITGYFLGDSRNKLEKGYVKTRAEEVVKCMHDTLDKELSLKNETVFIKPMMLISPNITIEIVNGVEVFFNNINEMKSENETQKTFGSNLKNVEAFLEAVNHAIGKIVKFVGSFEVYKKCHADNKPAKDKGTLDKKLEKELSFIENSSLCKLDTKSWVGKMIKHPHLVIAIKDFWTELMKTGTLEKQWNNLHWHQIGNSAGTLVSQLVRPTCSKEHKKSFMKKWKRRFMKK